MVRESNDVGIAACCADTFRSKLNTTSDNYLRCDMPHSILSVMMLEQCHSTVYHSAWITVPYQLASKRL